MRHLCFPIFVLSLALGGRCLAEAVVELRGGRVLVGEVCLSDGALLVTPRAGERQPVATKDVICVAFVDARESSEGLLRPVGEPDDWKTADVGPCGIAGSAIFHGQAIRVKESAVGLGGYSRRYDGHYFLYQPLRGDGQLTARVRLLKAPPFARAGLMVRQSLAKDAPFVMLSRAALDGRFGALQAREDAGQAVVPSGHSREDFQGTIWLKLIRKGDTFLGFESADGKKWELVSQHRVPMGADREVLIGLAAACGRDGAVATTEFDNVQLKVFDSTGAVTPPIGFFTVAGSIIAADVSSADSKEVRYFRGTEDEAAVRTENVSRLFFRPMTLAMLSRLPTGGQGVLLRSGDFVEGQFKFIRDGRVTISSVIFGLKTLELDQVAAIAINPPGGDKPRIKVRTADRSLFAVRDMRINEAGLVVDEPSAGMFHIGARELVEIRIAAPGEVLGKARQSAIGLDWAF